MNFQSSVFVEKKFGGRQEILEEIGKVWKQVDKIEKVATELLGKDNPISESLGYAGVHMMNTYQEIEENIQGYENKLVLKTLSQIIDVLSRIKWTGAVNRNGLIEAYQMAVKNVADFHGIHRNTIADACTRRLQRNRDGFLDLVDQWLEGESENLKRSLKAHCNITEHSLIDDFFDEKGGFRETY